MDRTLNDVRAFFLEHPFVGLVLPDGGLDGSMIIGSNTLGFT